MKKILIIILIIVLVVIGGIEIVVTMQNNKNNASNSSENEEKTEETFIFKDGEKEIKLGEEFSKEALGLGEEKNYSEIASCAFEGLDKTYTYENYEITTFPDGDKDKVSTTEGVKISDDKEKMISTYGEEYETQGNQYKYNKGKTNIEFIVENDIITSIQYSYVTE